LQTLPSNITLALNKLLSTTLHLILCHYQRQRIKVFMLLTLELRWSSTNSAASATITSIYSLLALHSYHWPKLHGWFAHKPLKLFAVWLMLKQNKLNCLSRTKSLDKLNIYTQTYLRICCSICDNHVVTFSTCVAFKTLTKITLLICSQTFKTFCCVTDA